MATKKVIKATSLSLSDLKTPDEMRAALITTQTELVEAKRSHAARELANTARLKELRLHIARIKTLLNRSDTLEPASKLKEKA